MPALTDEIGNYLDARGGLLVLRVLYDDGEAGVLTVSCHGPVNVPDTVFEGITATKGIIGYVDRGKPPLVWMRIAPCSMSCPSWVKK